MARAAAVIGKVAIKVYPQTTDFREELRRDLERIERTQGPVKIDVKVDTDGIARQVRETKERVEREVGAINLSFDPDKNGSLQRAIAKVNHELDKLSEIQLSVDLDEAELLAAREMLEAELARDKVVEIQVDDNIRGLQQARAEIQRMLDEKHQVRFEFLTDEDSLRAELEHVDEQIDAHMAREPVKLRYDPNNNESLTRALKEIEKRLEAVKEITFEFGTDTTSLEEAKAKIERELEDTKKIQLEIPNDIKGLREAQAKVDRMLAEKHAFKFEFETDEASLHEVRKHLDDLIDDYDNSSIDFEPDLDMGNFRYVTTRLAVLARDRWAKFKPVIDNKAYAKVEQALLALSGGRLLGSTLDNAWSLVKNLDKNIPLIAAVALALSGLVQWLNAGISNIAVFSRGLAQMFAASLALPGILGGIAFGIGSTVAVLKDFNLVLPGVKRSMSELQDQMSGNFWARAKAPMQDMVDRLFPEFRDGLDETAGALGVWFANLTTDLGSALQGEIKPMFDNLTTSILTSARFTESFATSIAILGKRGSEYLPRLANWVGELSEKFADWLTKKDLSGELNDFIDTGITRIMEFGRVLGGLGGILTSVAKAAESAGGSSLGMVADTLERVEDIVKGPVFQKGLINSFESAHRTMTKIAQVSGPAVKSFFETFTSTLSSTVELVGPAIGELVKGVFTSLDTAILRDGFLDLFAGINKGIVALAPAFEPIGEALAVLGSAIGSFAESFGPLLAELLTQMAEAAELLVPRVLEIAEALSGNMLDALHVVGPLLSVAASALLDLVSPLLESKVGFYALAGAIIYLRTQALFGAIAEGFLSITGGLRSIIQESPKLTAATGKITGALGKLKGAFGLAGIITAAVLALKAWGESTYEKTPSTTNFTNALNRMSVEMDNLATNPMMSGDPAYGLEQLFRLEPPGGWMSGIADASWTVNGLNDALTRLTAPNWQDRVASFGSSFGAIQDPIEMAAQALGSFDQALAQQVESGNMDVVNEAMDYYLQTAQESNLSIDEALARLPEYQAAMEARSIAEEQVAQQTEKVWQMTAQLSEAISSVGGVTPSMIASINDGSKAFIDFDAAMGDAYSGIDDYMAKLEEQIKAQSDWADDMAFLAQRGVSEGVLAELARMGPEGAPLVEDLVEKTSTGDRSYLTQMEEAFGLKSEGAVSNMDTEFGKLANLVDTHVTPMVEDINAELETLESTSKTVGYQVPAGLASGIYSNQQAAYTAADVVASNVRRRLESALEVHSPSRVAHRIGAFTTEGLAQGLVSNIDLVEKAGDAVAAAATNALSVDAAGVSVRNGMISRANVGQSGAASQKILNYYAAEGSSLGSEEDLFAAASRGRMVGW